MAAPARPTRALPLLAFLAVLPLLAGAAAAGERSYQVLRWNEDWTWIETDPPEQDCAFDPVKHVRLGGDWRFRFGGSFRLRFEADGNRTLGASAVEDDEALLARTFLHFELAHSDRFRWFSEVRWSDVWGEDRARGAIWRDDPDFQNFFLELSAGTSTTHPLTFRLGRQELLFGSQRLVSPLDWSNTRRTFDGLSLTLDTPRTKTVFFATHPVMHEPDDIDSPNDDQLFWGAHVTARPAPQHSVEGYAFVQRDDRDVFLNEAGDKAGDLERVTIGARWLYRARGWKADLEAAFQDGDQSTDDLSAWMFSGTGAYTWKDAPWSPTLEVGVDFASGDQDPLDGERETFDQLFPLGHAYFGHLDLVGRQNVQAWRLGLALAPAPKLKWVTTLHLFDLARDEDALYGAGGGVVRADPTGSAGGSVATELDVLVAWAFHEHHSLAFEIARWWSGDFIESTGDGDDAWLAWLAWEMKF